MSQPIPAFESFERVGKPPVSPGKEEPEETTFHEVVQKSLDTQTSSKDQSEEEEQAQDKEEVQDEDILTEGLLAGTVGIADEPLVEPPIVHVQASKTVEYNSVVQVPNQPLPTSEPNAAPPQELASPSTPSSGSAKEEVSASFPSIPLPKQREVETDNIKEPDLSSSIDVSQPRKSNKATGENSDTKDTERSLLSAQVERPIDVLSPQVEWSSSGDDRTFSPVVPILKTAPLDISETQEQVLPALEKVLKVKQLIHHMDEHVLRLVVSKQNAMVITLVPESLGKVVLSVNEDEGHHVRVEMLAESHAVLNVLKQQEAHLRDLFEHNGYKLSSFNVRQQQDDNERERRSNELARKGTKGKNLPADSSIDLTPNAKETIQKWSHSTGVWFVA